MYLLTKVNSNFYIKFIVSSRSKLSNHPHFKQNYGVIFMKRKNKTRGIAVAAIIASLYIVLTYISMAFGLSNGAIQVRLSEALTVLPVFTPYAIPGLFVGCLISNLLTGCALWDIIFGSLATLLASVFTYLLREFKYSPLIPPIILNTIIVPLVLLYVYSLEGSFMYFAFTVFIGEFISCGILGTLLRKSINKRNIFKSL